MLSRPHRLTASREFSRTVREGVRAGSRTLVVHLTRPEQPAGSAGSAGPARAGFVVGRSVGSAVARNRVKRRLRHLAADQVRSLPAGVTLVVRALPPAATATHQELGRDLDKAIRRAAAGAGRALASTPDRSPTGGVA